jgi:hypothetical protein
LFSPAVHALAIRFLILLGFTKSRYARIVTLGAFVTCLSPQMWGEVTSSRASAVYNGTSFFNAFPFFILPVAPELAFGLRFDVKKGYFEPQMYE